MSLINYTKEELEKLSDFIREGSPIGDILVTCEYDPERFYGIIKRLKKESVFVYETPLSELPLTMSDPRYEGWRKWRFSIGK